MPDPSGAARAPQTTDELVTRVRGALKLWETATFEELRALERHAPEMLGALVQAVEDQQRTITGLNDDVAMRRLLHENCCRERASLENEAVDHRGRKPILWRVGARAVGGGGWRVNVVSWLVAVKHAAEEALALSVMSPLPARKAAFQAFGNAVLPGRAKAMATVTLAAKALRALEANPPDSASSPSTDVFWSAQVTKARRDLDAAIEACNAVG